MAGWHFWIDRGGTFTDCIGFDASARRLSVTKVLSGDSAPVEGIRKLLGLVPKAPIPPCEVRMGTTIATNALLERRGVKTALVITRGFRDLLEIGRQTRPKIYDLKADHPEPLVPRERRFEVAERIGPAGEVIVDLTEAEIAPLLRRESHAVNQPLRLDLPASPVWVEQCDCDLSDSNYELMQIAGVIVDEPYGVTHLINHCTRVVADGQQ